MLQNLVNTLETCKEYHLKKDNTIHAKMIQEQIDRATEKTLVAPLNTNDSLYHEE